MAERGGRSIRLGLVSAWIAEDYTREFMAGVWDGALGLGASVIGFFGGRLPAVEREEAGRQLAYDLITPSVVDGVVALWGPTFTGPDAFDSFAGRIPTVPIVVAGGAPTGIPSIVVDNEIGFREEIAHLIEVHGRQRIAFITGPPYNAEAQIRLDVYRKVLAAHGLADDPSRIVQGAFDEPSGSRATLTLVENEVPFDAIVCSNDTMAFGAISVLRRRGVRIPQDVSVVGFDDMNATSTTPPLTSVRQPIYEMGQTAARTLVDRIRGNEVPLLTQLPTQMIARESCGCSRFGHPTIRTPDGRAQRRADLEQTLAREMVPGHARLGELLAALRSDIETGDAEFVRVFQQILAEVVSRGQDPVPWQKALPRVRQAILADFDGPEQCATCERLLHTADGVLSDALDRIATRRQIDEQLRLKVTSHIGHVLAMQESVPSLLGQIPWALQALDIPSCHVAVLGADPATSRLLFSYRNRRQLPLGDDAALGSTALPCANELLLAQCMEGDGPAQFLILPLASFGERIGFVIVQTDQRDAHFLIALQQQLSSNLKRLERDKEIERLHEADRSHALELERAYNLLQENQNRLVIAEKMASLGRLTAGIAHEMNTPLGAVRGALAELARLIEEYRESVGCTEVTDEDHRAIASEMDRAVAIADSAAARATAFVRGIKLQTRGMATRERRSFDPVAVVNETLLLLQHALRSGQCRIEFAPPALRFELYGPPARFSQVITNLLTNAIDASRPKGGGPIRIELSAGPDGSTMIVRDEGVGIARENLAKIFDPMFTTKPFGEGTGLGLSLVHDIVRGDFGGTVDVVSEIDHGATFIIAIPWAHRQAPEDGTDEAAQPDNCVTTDAPGYYPPT